MAAEADLDITDLSVSSGSTTSPLSLESVDVGRVEPLLDFLSESACGVLSPVSASSINFTFSWKLSEFLDTVLVPPSFTSFPSSCKDAVAEFLRVCPEVSEFFLLIALDDLRLLFDSILSGVESFTPLFLSESALELRRLLFLEPVLSSDFESGTGVPSLVIVCDALLLDDGRLLSFELTDRFDLALL